MQTGLILVTTNNGNKYEVDYWDLYFLLKALPKDEEWISVDIPDNTRDYAVIAGAEHYGHVGFNEENISGVDMITSIAISQRGIKFYNYLVGCGYPEREHEYKYREL